MNELLFQKLCKPILQADLISRAYLMAALNAGLSARLILISASTGFGKTTLLSQWLQTLDNVGVGWVSLDESDNDPARFLAYLSAATAHAFGLRQVQQIYGSDDRDNLIGALIALLNTVSVAASASSRQVIVLDDFHLIQNHTALTLLATYLEHMPESVHLVISSRVDPPLSLGRLRARGQLVEIRQRDLRFTLDQASDFLQRGQPHTLDAQQVGRLYERTEGWIAGLQLAALALPDEPDRRDTFIRAFAGSHRIIVDYLYDEVWQGQPAEIRAFLLATCVLDRFNAALCDAVRQRNDSATLIDRIARQNLFVVPLDDRREWYRYHHLFADLLRVHLQQSAPEMMILYHQRAGAWFLEAGEDIDRIGLAFSHLLAAGDHRQAAKILEIHGESVWQSGQHDRLRGWLDRLAGDPLPHHPQINILRAWFAMVGGDHALARRYLAGLADRALPDVLRGKVAAVTAFQALLEGRLDVTIGAAQRALSHLDQTMVQWRRTATIALADAYNIRGQLQEAHSAYHQVLRSDPQRSNPYMTLNAAFKLAGTYRRRGLLQQAYDTCTRYLEDANHAGLSGTTLAGCLLALRGDIRCDWGQLDGALVDTQAAIDASRHSYHAGLLGWIYLFRLRTLLAIRDLDQFDTTLSLYRELNRPVGLPPWLDVGLAVLTGLRWLVNGNLAAARSWAIERGLHPSEPVDKQRVFEFVILARMLLAEEDTTAALALTERILTTLEDHDDISAFIVTHILRSLIFRSKGNAESAQTALARALHLAEPGGFVQLFVEGGSSLREMLAQQADSPLRQRILAAFARQATLQPRPERLIEPLSERELDVLRLIADGLSNQAVADTLFITLNTVLYHTKNIYGKLGVKRRTQAVHRARELHLL